MQKLKILCTNSAPLIRYGIAAGFRNLGHEVFIMENQYQLWDKDKETQFEIFKQVVEEFKPDIVFSECFANFSEHIFVHTREKGIFHAFWSIEDTPHTHWIGDYWSDYADVIFTTTAECLPNYWNKGKKAELLLFGCNPDFHKGIPNCNEYDVDIALVANNYSSRSYQVTDFLIPLIEKGYKIKVWGNSWWTDGSHEVDLRNHRYAYNGYLSYEDTPKLYSSCKIALGFNCDGDSVTQTSMRMYEVLSIAGSNGAIGSLLLSPYTKAQEFLFHDLIYLPKNTDEMFLMVEEILSMSDKQRKIKTNKASRFVQKYHNYTLRAQQVIDVYKGCVSM